MHRYGCAVLLSCVLAASALAAEDQGKKDTRQASAKETASQEKADAETSSAPPKEPVKPPAEPAPRVNVEPGVHIGVTPGSRAPRDRRGRVRPGVGVYVPVPLPSASQPEQPPAYGNVPAPAPEVPAGAVIPAYDAGEAPQPTAREAAPPPGPENTAAHAAPPLPAPLAGRYAGMQGRTLHTWEFRPDGTFEHAWTASGDPAGAATVEAGTFTLMGPYLDLTVWGRAAMRSAPRGRAGSHFVRRLRLGMLGPRAGNAIVLDGVVLKPQNK